MLTLVDLPFNTVAQIVQFDITAEDSRIRLIELGIIVGEKVQVIRKAPLGDPIEIEIMNYRLCLRKEDAKNIYVRI